MGQKRVIQGTVISDKMDKTVVVQVARRKKHSLYRKVITVTSHYKAHDEANTCRIGDEVRIIECRPVSKEKRWRIFEVLTQGDVADIAPDTIGRELEAATQVAPKHEAGDEPEDQADEPAAEIETEGEDGPGDQEKPE